MLLLLSLAVLPFFSAQAAQSVAFGWEQSADVNAIGYNIYYGTASHVYTSKVSVGNVTNATITGFLEGATYYFAATTYDTFNLESSFCEEIPYTIPGQPASEPPVITSLQAASQAAAGQSFNFIATASGTEPLACQWLLNGARLASATNSILSFNNVSLTQAGIYVLVVTNSFGSTTSAPINLVISPVVQVITPALPVNGQFALNIAGQPGGQYVIEASTNLANWIALVTNVSPFAWVDANSSQCPQRFYRTHLLNVSAPDAVNDITNGLFAYYPLAANGNDLQNGNNLVLAGFPTFSAGAINWNGVVPTLGYSAPRQWPQSGVTVSAWINMADPSANYIIAACYGDSSGQLQQSYMQFFTQNGGLNARIVQHIDADYIGRVTSSDLTTGWHFAAFTWSGGTDSGSIKIYLDGVQVDNADASGGNFTAAYGGSDLPFTLGTQFSDGWGISGKFYGSQKGVRMYDRALASEEINALYNNGTSVGNF